MKNTVYSVIMPPPRQLKQTMNDATPGYSTLCG